MSFKEVLDDLTPHRLLGLPSLIEGMKPAPIKMIPARSVNQPITTPIASAKDKQGAARDLMRRRRATTLSGGDAALSATSSLYTPLIG